MDAYLNYQIKPDFRMAGPILGAKIKAFGGAVNKLDPKQLLAEMSANGKIVLNLNGEDTDVTSDMVSVNVNAKEGFSAAQEGDVCVILDTNLTEDLVREGLARELVSKVQQMRKSKDFEMMDRIRIYVGADEAVSGAIDAYKDWIMGETLADSIEAKDGLEEFDLNGHKTGIDVERI